MKAIIPITPDVSIDVHGEPREVGELLLYISDLYAAALKRAVQASPREIPFEGPAAPVTPRAGKNSELRTANRPCGCGPYGMHRKATCTLVPRDGAPPTTAPPTAAKGCPECGSPSKHKANCSKPGKPPAAPIPPVRRRGASHNGVSLGPDAGDPDYGKHGRLYDMPTDVLDHGENGRTAPVSVPGEVHTHMFHLPEANGPESLGRCACGQTRRFRNPMVVA